MRSPPVLALPMVYRAAQIVSYLAPLFLENRDLRSSPSPNKSLRISKKKLRERFKGLK
uniref:Uncharacterized protein n=1 Tax=Picea glauca TaxID=3330 RepID=A0A124GMK2_PICGL|nr:hypothetical protein ABT39_MTgene2262 [Picea glauca]